MSNFRSRLVGYLCLLVVPAASVLALGSALAQTESLPTGFKQTQTPFDELRPDAAWCGPRVLFFLAQYLGSDCSLDRVVELCRSDAEGFTRLDRLVAAAAELGLDPVAIGFPPEQVTELDGPAILCVRKAFSPKGSKSSIPEARLHFIALACKKDGRHCVLDPSRDTSLVAFTPERLRAVSTGHAVLLRGSTVPALRVSGFRFRTRWCQADWLRLWRTLPIVDTISANNWRRPEPCARLVATRGFGFGAWL
jgi:ABC-type bacteriocin/lantibiotic exporter with double-glycine peptidase domain